MVQLSAAETPARSATTVVVVPDQPSSARHSTVASISRVRVVRLRSALGVRGGADMVRACPLTYKQSSLHVSYLGRLSTWLS